MLLSFCVLPQQIKATQFLLLGSGLRAQASGPGGADPTLIFEQVNPGYYRLDIDILNGRLYIVLLVADIALFVGHFLGPVCVLTN